MCNSNGNGSSSLSCGWQEVPPQQGATGCHRVTHASNSVQSRPVRLSPTQPRSVDALPQTLWQIKFVCGTTKDVERESEGRRDKVREGEWQKERDRKAENDRERESQKGVEREKAVEGSQVSMRFATSTHFSLNLFKR